MSWVRRPSVVEVAGGEQRAAWYDLQRKRILLRASSLADQTPLDAPDAMVLEFMHSTPPPTPISVPRAAHSARDDAGVKLLSIELAGGASLPKAADLLREAAGDFACMHACIIAAAGDVAGAVSLASTALEVGMMHVDVLVNTDARMPVDLDAHVRVVRLDVTTILAARSRAATSDVEAFARLFPVSPRSFVVDPDLFRLLHYFSPDHGVLYCRVGEKDVAVSAGPFGSPHKVDWVPTQGLAAARDSSPMQSLWHASPDRIASCRDCVFRYACRNSRVFRAAPDDLASPPANCRLGLH